MMKTSRERRTRLMGVTGEELGRQGQSRTSVDFRGWVCLRICCRRLDCCYVMLALISDSAVISYLRPSLLDNGCGGVVKGWCRA